MPSSFIVAIVLATLGCDGGRIENVSATGGQRATTGGTGGGTAFLEGGSSGSTYQPSVEPPITGAAGAGADGVWPPRLPITGGAGGEAAGGSPPAATIIGAAGAEPSGGSPPVAIGSTGGFAGSAGATPNTTQRAYVLYDANTTGMSRDIYVKSLDGQCERLLVGTDAQEKQPAISNDGRKLAYAANGTGTYQIYVKDLVTGVESMLTDIPAGATHPSWSPDGTQIVFMTGDRETSASTRGDVMLLDVPSRQTRLLYAGTNGICCIGYMSPVFADNDLVLVGNGVSLVGIHVATGVSYDVVAMAPRIPNPQDPSPSPDGKLFAFADYCGGQLQIYVARIDGTTGDTCTAALPLAKHPAGLLSPTWGPSGTIVAETRDANLVLLHADGTGTAEIFVDIPGPVHNPIFAPTAFVDSSCR